MITKLSLPLVLVALAQSAQATVLLADPISGATPLAAWNVDATGAAATPTLSVNTTEGVSLTGVGAVNTANETASRNFTTTAPGTDTFLKVEFDARLRVANQSTFQLSLLDGAGTALFAIGTSGVATPVAADVLLAGTALSAASYAQTPGITTTANSTSDNLFRTGGHEFFNFQLLYNETAGTGTLYAREYSSGGNAGNRAFPAGSTTGAFVVGTFSTTAGFDISTIARAKIDLTSTSERFVWLNIESSDTAFAPPVLVPEPSAGLLGILALTSLFSRRRR